MYFCFLRSKGADKACVRDLAVGGYFGLGYEVDGVGSFDAGADTLGTASELIGGRVEPVCFGGCIGDEGSVFHAGAGDWVNDGVCEGVHGQVIGLVKECC